MAHLKTPDEQKEFLTQARKARNTVLQSAHLDGLVLVEIPPPIFRLIDKLDRSCDVDTRDRDSLKKILAHRMHKWVGVLEERVAPKEPKSKAQKYKNEWIAYEYNTKDFLAWKAKKEAYEDYIEYILKIRSILDVFENEFMCYDRIQEKKPGVTLSPQITGKNKNMETNIGLSTLESRFLKAGRTDQTPDTSPMVVAMQMVRKTGATADELHPVAFLSYTTHKTFGAKPEDDNPLVKEFKTRVIADGEVSADAMALEINIICKQKEKKFGATTKRVTEHLLAYAIANSLCTKHHVDVVFVEATPLRRNPQKYPAQRVCKLLGLEGVFKSKKKSIAEQIFYLAQDTDILRKLMVFLNNVPTESGGDVDRICYSRQSRGPDGWWSPLFHSTMGRCI